MFITEVHQDILKGKKTLLAHLKFRRTVPLRHHERGIICGMFAIPAVEKKEFKKYMCRPLLLILRNDHQSNTSTGRDVNHCVSSAPDSHVLDLDHHDFVMFKSMLSNIGCAEPESETWETVPYISGGPVESFSQIKCKSFPLLSAGGKSRRLNKLYLKNIYLTALFQT